MISRTLWNTFHGGDVNFEGRARLHHREDEIIKTLKELGNSYKDMKQELQAVKTTNRLHP